MVPAGDLPKHRAIGLTLARAGSALALLAGLVLLWWTAAFFTAEPAPDETGLPLLFWLVGLALAAATGFGMDLYLAGKRHHLLVAAVTGLVLGVLTALAYEALLLGNAPAGFLFLFIIPMLFFAGVVGLVVVIGLFLGAAAVDPEDADPRKGGMAFGLAVALLMLGFALRALAAYPKYIEAARNACFIFC